MPVGADDGVAYVPSPVSEIVPLTTVAAEDQSRPAHVPPEVGATGPTSFQSSVPLAPPVLPTRIESVNEPAGSTSEDEAVVDSVGVTGGAAAVSPTLGGSAGSSGVPL